MEQNVLQRICDLLAQPTYDKKELKKLLKKAKIDFDDDPFKLSNSILQKLHQYQEIK